MKILIADDDPTSAALIERTLATKGKCDIVTDGRRAFLAFCKALRKYEPYDAVCVDLDMPSVNGLEAIQQIREMESSVNLPGMTVGKVKVFVISGHDSPNVIDNASKTGCDAFVSKNKLKEELEREFAKHFPQA